MKSLIATLLFTTVPLILTAQTASIRIDAERPMRKDIAWGGYDSNQVGTDEWIRLNKADTYAPYR